MLSMLHLARVGCGSCRVVISRWCRARASARVARFGRSMGPYRSLLLFRVFVVTRHSWRPRRRATSTRARAPRWKRERAPAPPASLLARTVARNGCRLPCRSFFSFLFPSARISALVLSRCIRSRSRDLYVLLRLLSMIRPSSFLPPTKPTTTLVRERTSSFRSPSPLARRSHAAWVAVSFPADTLPLSRAV